MGASFCSEPDKIQPRVNYFIRPEAFDDPVNMDSPSSENVSFVSQISDQVERKEKYLKLSQSSRDFEGSTFSQNSSLSPSNKAKNKRKVGHSRVRTTPIKLPLWDDGGQVVRVNGSYSPCTEESSSPAVVRNNIKTILQPLVGEKSEKKLDKNIDKMLAKLILNFGSFEKGDSLVSKTQSTSERKPIWNGVSRRQASFNGSPLPSTESLSHVLEDPKLKPLGTSSNLEKPLSNMREDISHTLSEIISLKTKISELTTDIYRLQQRSVDNFCQKDTEVEGQRHLLENQLKNFKKELSTKLLDIQVNLLSGKKFDYLEKLGMNNAFLYPPVYTPLKLRQNSKSEGYKTKVSDSKSLPKAVIYRANSTPELTPIPLNWDSSPRRLKIVGRHSDNILVKIDENRKFIQSL